jgi:putative two-component system response regulator
MADPEGRPPRLNIAGSRPRALVVDDDATIRAMFSDALSGLFAVDTAGSGAEAHACLDGGVYDLIVVDQMLPDCTGVGLIETTLAPQPDALRILITASRDIETATEAVNRARVDRFFVKPVQIEELRRQAAEGVRARRAERDLRERIDSLRAIEARSAPVRGRVLVVDDDEGVLAVFQAVLEDAGYEVACAETGQEALDHLGSGVFNLVVMDKNLPDTSGIEVLQVARKLQPDIEAVVVTAYASTDSAIQAVEAGAYDYLRKPLNDIEILPRVVRRALERQALSRERQRLLLELLDANAALSSTNQELRAAQHGLKRKIEEMDLLQDATVVGLARLAEYRDVETGQHLERMRSYARIIAEELAGEKGFENVDEAFVDAIFKTAPLHDIGKVGIPDRILLKPDKLTPDEWRIMRTHPVIGGQTLEEAERRAGHDGPIGLLALGKNIAYFHHERWDGGGYPFRKRGEEIPVEARIVTVADAYDAITSRRCYKPSIPHATAQAILLKERDAHFDGRVVDAFVRREAEILEVKARYAGDEVDLT